MYIFDPTEKATATIKPSNRTMANRTLAPFPILTTKRLTLRPLSIDDKQNIFALRSDEAVNKYLGRAPSKTIEDAINFINQINANIQQNNSIYWVIMLTKTKTFVGTICLFDFSDEKNSCEIGFELMPKFQNQGIMKEAVAEVITYAFHTLQFQKIVAFTHYENQVSIKLLAKFNFLQSPEISKKIPDYLIYTLTA